MGSATGTVAPVLTDPRERRAVGVEIAVVLSLTLGLSGLRSLLRLVDSLLAPEPLASQSVALNQSTRAADLIDLGLQLTGAVELLATGALAAYLLWRAGVRLSAVGLDRSRPGRDAALGAGLATIIGVPGLAFYLVTRALGVNLTVVPAALDDTWWRFPVLLVSAVANAVAEELLVVAWLITRLRQLGWGEARSLLASALLRGSYHLYQGFGGFIGNVVMGLVFGTVWQRTGRVWSLVVAHSLINIVAFVGYAALRGRVGWLP